MQSRCNIVLHILLKSICDKNILVKQKIIQYLVSTHVSRETICVTPRAVSTGVLSSLN